MGPKRVRTPQYITAFGDGNVHVRDRRQSHGNDVFKPPLRKSANNAGGARSRERMAAQELPSAVGGDRWDVFLQSSEAGGDEIRGSSDAANPWQLSAIALLGTVVLLSALFLHVIADTVDKNSQYHRRHHAAARRQRPAVKVRKKKEKKDDEWINDQEEDNPHSHCSGTTTEIDSPQPFAYHPYPSYQDAGLQQRRISTASGAGPSVNAGRSFHPHPHHYYLNQSGGPVISSYANTNNNNASPSSALVNNRSSAHNKNNNNNNITNSPRRQNGLSADSTSSSPLCRPDLESESHHQLQLPQPQPPVQHHSELRTTTLCPRPLSSASSFASSVTEHTAGSKTTPRQDEDKDTDTKVPPSFHRHQSPSVSLQLRVPGTDGQYGQSHVLISAGTDDGDGTPMVSRETLTLAETPLAANTRPIVDSVPEHSSLAVTDQPQPVNPSPGKHTNTQENLDADIPFMPSLRLAPNGSTLPKPMNVDELQMYQDMETGSVSHWEARIREESRMLEHQAFPAQQAKEEEEEQEQEPAAGEQSPASTSASDSGSSVSLASNDPRKSIIHKRKNLATFTDAGASLQGAIDFAELDLLEVIGGGGFGQVWKAIWRGTPVAVKVLTGSAQSKHVPKPILQEFAGELNILKGMRHPNICLYMGACLAPPNRAIITELAANGSLWDALRLPLAAPYVPSDGVSRNSWPLALYQPDSRHGAPPTPAMAGLRFPPSVPPRGTWPWILVKRVATGAARGMAYLHSGKPPILHRDLKSANILLDESYTAKVCDFGLSRLKAQERSMTGNCGTVQWMAPEVLANESYNEKADVFSYGIICWELLTRECPYEGMSAIQSALAVLKSNYRPEIPKWCPPPLHALIRSCVKKIPGERPSFVEIIQTLDSMPSNSERLSEVL